ncbi:hypothetical protein EDB87DRAFT_1822166 [Lactarius vividus]|nr:hypothetical protein EDB87DRAFT_1822166 [Lactarius vividus]
MTKIITEIMVKVLTIFGIATKELRRGSAMRVEKFLKKLAGRTDLEDAVKKLDRLTQEEARMALAEVLKITHIFREDVKVVDGKVESTDNKVEDMGDKVDNVGDKVDDVGDKVEDIGDRVQCVDEKVKVVQEDKRGDERSKINYPTDGEQHRRNQVLTQGNGRVVLSRQHLHRMEVYWFTVVNPRKTGLREEYHLISTSSSLCCGILNRIYKSHKNGAHQPSDDTLKECLKEMLRLPGREPIFIILDALDECPDSSGIPSPRNEVLQLVKELVDLDLQRFHICTTSRPEVDIRAVLEPLAFCSVSLHDESGQKTDIADYVRNIVNSSPSIAMRRWRADDKNLVIETLTEGADGMFRWVFCQLDGLRHCFPPNLRQFLNEFPESLDETYERILRGIHKAQKDNAHRLLQCLAVAVRPLRVEELAELLAFDFQASSSGIPRTIGGETIKRKPLIAITPRDDSRVVQFSHFSVKEYFTSPRLAQSEGDISRFYIDLNGAHTILALACLGTVLRLDEHADAKWFPLVEYAARH